LEQVLHKEQCRGLLVSLNTPASEDESETRKSQLIKLMPDLEKTRKGDELSLNQFPHLKNIIQTGF